MTWHDWAASITGITMAMLIIITAAAAFRKDPS